MKKLFLITFCFLFNHLFSQVYVMHGVKVLPEDQSLFEKIETQYVSKIAQDAVNKGNLGGWGLIKIDPYIGESGGYNYIFVNGFRDIDHMNENSDWWANSKEVLGIEPDILYRDLVEESGRYVYKQQMEIQGKNPAKHIAFYFGYANNIADYLKIEKQWIPWHKKNMPVTGLVSWGVGTKFLPVNPSQRTNVMTWNIFNKRSDIMKFIGGELKTSPFPKTNQNNVMPNGWENIVIGEILSFVQ